MTTNEALKKWNKEKSGHEDRVRRRAGLESQNNELSSQIENLKSDLAKHKAAKDEAVLSLAHGNISSDAVDKIRNVYDAAAKTLSDSEEVMTALQREINGIHTSKDALNSAESDVWDAYFGDLSKEINSQIGPLLLKANVALRFSRRGYSWPDTLISIFGREKEFSEIKDLSEKLRKELFR